MNFKKPANTTVFIIKSVLMALFVLTVYLYFLYRDYQEREVVAFSQLSVCTKNGESVKQTSRMDGSPLFHVPKEINRIYICGTIDSPFGIILGINLFQMNGEDENVVFIRIRSRWLEPGPFVFDVTSTEKLDAGEYRAKLTIGRIYKGDVHFLVEK